MSTVELHDDHITINFSFGEKLGGLIRDQQIPLGSVVSVELETDPIAATRGWRAPGLGVPGSRKIGHWRSPNGHELVCVRKGEPAVRLRLRSHPYDSVLIGTAGAASLTREIRDRLA